MSVTAASPLLCARHGWKNIGINTIQCVDCDTVLHCSAWALHRPADPEDDHSITSHLVKRHRDSCIWRADPCPESYMRLQLTPIAVISRSLIKRFDSFHQLWDLPVLPEQLPCEQPGMDVLCEFLFDQVLDRLLKASGNECEAEWKKRVKTQAWLALLGWELQWEETFIYADNNDLNVMEFTRGPGNDPNRTHICFGRQSRVYCPLCTGRRSLWRYETESTINCQAFVSMSKRLKESREAAPMTRIKRKRDQIDQETEEVPSKRLAPSQKPAFGMKVFRRATPAETSKITANSRKPETEMKLDDVKQEEIYEEAFHVLSPHQFNPITSHRYFCPFRHDWERLLTALTDG